jgi:putative endonuclease
MSRAAGGRAEDRALSFLEARGLELVARNVTLRVGEIDLVMRDRETLVFVEVRLRRGGGMVSPEESVSAAKRKRLARAAGAFLARHEALSESPARFDVVAIEARGNNNELTWIRDAFAPDGSW